MSEVYTGTLGQGLNLSGLNLVVGAKSKYRTIGIRAIGNRTNDYLSINRSIEDEFHADVE